jgi:hypothetical protein
MCLIFEPYNLFFYCFLGLAVTFDVLDEKIKLEVVLVNRFGFVNFPYIRVN